MTIFGFFLMFVAMIGATGLAGGGYYLIRKGTDVTRGRLMIIAAAVVVGNVLILTI